MAEKVAMGAPLATSALACTRLCTVPSRGMVICWLATLTTPESARVTKYRLYSWLRMKAKAPTPTTKIAVLRVTARTRPKKPMPPPAAPCLRALVKFSRCRVASMSPKLMTSPARKEVIR
ncbi:hypothetical protein D3C80_1809970 [compost metagenome]